MSRLAEQVIEVIEQHPEVTDCVVAHALRRGTGKAERVLVAKDDGDNLMWEYQGLFLIINAADRQTRKSILSALEITYREEVTLRLDNTLLAQASLHVSRNNLTLSEYLSDLLTRDLRI